jgi:hypothetical protein
MKGTLEICFPEITQARISLKSPLFTRLTQHITTSRKRKITKYFQAMRKEYWLRKQGPCWQNFKVASLSLRLNSDWIGLTATAAKFSTSLLGGDTSNKSQLQKIAMEIILSADDACNISPNCFIIEESPTIVLYDLDSLTPGNNLKKLETHSSALRANKKFGIELQASNWSDNQSTLRNQLHIVSILQPDFMRICQRRVAGDGSLFGTTLNLKSRMKLVQLSLDAFSALGYEAVGSFRHQIVLVRCNDSKENESLRPTTAASIILGIGAGGVSMRYDAQGRVITHRNPDKCRSYLTYINNLWSTRNGYTTAQYLPYIHQAIERSFKSNGRLSYSKIQDSFGVDLEQLHPGLSRVLENAGYVKRLGDEVELTSKGRIVSSKVIRNFFVSEGDLQFII